MPKKDMSLGREARAAGIPPEAAKAFYFHRRTAKERGIEFLFTLQEWWAWWTAEPGRWERRGKGQADFMMARRGDKGPYSPENVYCATGRENRLEAIPAIQEAIKRAGAAGKMRRDFLCVRGDGHPRSRAVITPQGRFGSTALAAEALDVHQTTVAKKARKQIDGYRYEDEQ